MCIQTHGGSVLETYTNRDIPYRATSITHHTIPMTLTARIESDDPYTRLDEQGKFQIGTL